MIQSKRRFNINEILTKQQKQFIAEYPNKKEDIRIQLELLLLYLKNK